MYKLLIFIFMLGTDSPQQETIQSVELSYQTRGTQKFLHITSDSVEVKINGKITHYKTTEGQWQKILKSFQKVKLSGIAKLKRPSTKSFYDGALISQVKVITNLKEYESVNFDHDAPPTALVKPINAMKSTLIGTENKRNF
ncbi:MAG: hypothetical protein H7339_08195 [Arcicella sp.]|nr:hypothetical protein [Arcicella sp.]